MNKNTGLKIVGIISIIIGILVAAILIISNIENLSLAQALIDSGREPELSRSLFNELVMVITFGAIAGVLCFVNGVVCCLQKNKTICSVSSIIAFVIALIAVIISALGEYMVMPLIPLLVLTVLTTIMSITSRKN